MRWKYGDGNWPSYPEYTFLGRFYDTRVGRNVDGLVTSVVDVLWTRSGYSQSSHPLGRVHDSLEGRNENGLISPVDVVLNFKSGEIMYSPFSESESVTLRSILVMLSALKSTDLGVISDLFRYMDQ